MGDILKFPDKKSEEDKPKRARIDFNVTLEDMDEFYVDEDVLEDWTNTTNIQNIQDERMRELVFELFLAVNDDPALRDFAIASMERLVAHINRMGS